MSARPVTSSSNLHRRALCPGSEGAEAPFIHEVTGETTSEEAAEGHMMHALAADPVLDRGHLTAEQDRALDRAAMLKARMIEQVESAEGMIGRGAECVEGHEQELAMHDADAPATVILTGHCDYWRYYPARRVLIILDNKFGRIEVESADRNLQLRAYAVQAAEVWDCEKIYCGIVQPRVFSDFPPQMTLYNRDDLANARAEILSILDGCHALDAPLIASEEACKYCRATATCPAYQAQITAPLPLIGVPVVSLSNEQLAVCLRAISMLNDKWVDAIKARARELIQAGTLPGFVLKQNPARREITDFALAFHALREAGFTDEQLFAAAKLNVSAAEKLYATRGKEGKDAREALAAVLGENLIARPIAPSIKAAA